MVMSRQAKQLYEFGPFRIDVAERLLLRDGESVSLTPKAFDLLLVLVENRGHLLEKGELMRRLWPETFVEETNLSNNISLLRKVLGDDAGKHVYIETVPRRGYRFIAEVVGLSDELSELIVEERIKSAITLEQEEESDLARTDGSLATRPPLPMVRSSTRQALLAFVGCLAVIGLASIAYYLWAKQGTLPGATKTAAEVQPSLIKSVAVLPFKPLAADGRDESLELGMAETLITRLSGVAEVAVRSMSAVRKYNALDQDPILAGGEQKVDAVLDGNIQKTAGRIRVTVRLLRVSDGRTLWADKFDAPLADLFALQDSISERVVTALEVKLTGEERRLLTRHHTDNPEAYQLYLKGRLFRNHWTQESIQKALECFNRAIDIDPNYALAYAGKADVYSANSSVYLRPAEAMPKAREAARRALELDDQLAEAHRSMAMVKQFGDWDLAGAEREIKRALEINPNDSESHLRYCGLLVLQKRFDEALAELRRAQELDPLSLSLNFWAGWHPYLARKYEQAMERFREAAALYPNAPEMHRGLGCALRQQGAIQEAVAELEKAIDLSRRDNFVAELGYTYALSGRRAEAVKLVKELEGLSERRYVSPFNIAKIYAGLGDKERMFEWLHKGYEDRSDHMLGLGVDPCFDGVRADPRFAELLRRLGLT